MIKIFAAAIILSCISGILVAQEHVSNIRVQQRDAMLYVAYDLAIRADIEVFVSFDNGVTFRGPLQNVSGAVGKNILPEKDKMLVWNATNEIDIENFSNMVIKIVAASTYLSTTEVPTLIAIKRNVYKGGLEIDKFAERSSQKEYQKGFELDKYAVRSIMMPNSLELSMYEKGRRNRTLGLTSLSIGGAAIATSVGIYFGELIHENPHHGFVISGIVCTLVGTGLTITGTICMSKSKKYIRNSVDIYNNSINRNARVDFDFGFTGNGVGVAVHF